MSANRETKTTKSERQIKSSMKTMKNIKLAFASIVIALVGFITTAQATLIMQPLDFPAVNQSENVPYSTTLNFNKFNPALGTLNGVSMIVNAEFQADVSIINWTSFPKIVNNAFATIPVTISGPNGLNYTMNANALLPNAVVPSYFLNSTIYSFSGVPVNIPTITQTIPGAQWSAYEGIGNIPLTFSLTDGEGTYGGCAYSWVFFGGRSSANGDVTLQYNYTPVPEPGTLLSGFGAALLFIFTAIPKKHRVV